MTPVARVLANTKQSGTASSEWPAFRAMRYKLWHARITSAVQGNRIRDLDSRLASGKNQRDAAQ
jgi:hypothetical protein